MFSGKQRHEALGVWLLEGHSTLRTEYAMVISRQLFGSKAHAKQKHSRTNNYGKLDNCTQSEYEFATLGSWFQ